MNENKERHIDIQNLKRYPEFYALRRELEDFCGKMDDINDINLDGASRITLEQEIYGRRYASEKVKDLLSTLGLIDKTNIKRDKTHE
jgi:hypothetical protein